MNETSTKPPILIPIDFSETSERGVQEAARWAKKLDARLVLLHVIEFHPAYYSPPVPESWYGQEAISACNGSMRDIARKEAGDEIEVGTTVLVQVDPASAIVEYAERIGATMIVMGTHGSRGIHRAFLGSTAESVVRHAHCPVMTVGPVRDEARKAA